MRFKNIIIIIITIIIIIIIIIIMNIWFVRVTDKGCIDLSLFKQYNCKPYSFPFAIFAQQQSTLGKERPVSMVKGNSYFWHSVSFMYTLTLNCLFYFISFSLGYYYNPSFNVSVFDIYFYFQCTKKK